MALSRDPVANSIRRNMIEPIRLLIEHHYGAAAAILILAGIDAMANIARPESADHSTPDDFKCWVRQYFHLTGDTEITPDEWWAARNAIIHTFGVYSLQHRSSELRILGWYYDIDTGDRQILYDWRHSEMVLVDVGGMFRAFVAGVDRFLEDARAVPEREALIHGRLNELLMHFPFPPDTNRTEQRR